MNKEKKYLDLGKSLLSGPYLVWMTGFTIIPLLMILWYGKYPVNRRTGSYEGSGAVSGFIPDQHSALPFSCISSGYDFKRTGK